MMMTRLDTTEPIACFDCVVSPEQSQRFFEAVGWELASRPGMPPTIATVFRAGEFEALKKLEIPLQSVLHGEQKYRFHHDLCPGQAYLGKTYLNSRLEKSGSGGTMTFYVFQTNLTDSTGKVVVECISTIISRSKA